MLIFWYDVWHHGISGEQLVCLGAWTWGSEISDRKSYARAWLVRMYRPYPRSEAICSPVLCFVHDCPPDCSFVISQAGTALVVKRAQGPCALPARFCSTFQDASEQLRFRASGLKSTACSSICSTWKQIQGPLKTITEGPHTLEPGRFKTEANNTNRISQSLTLRPSLNNMFKPDSPNAACR